METGWHFLTGEQVPIQRLANAVGFQFRYDPKNDLFAHPSCIIILTPEGKVARYFFALRDPNDPGTFARPPSRSGRGVGAQDRHAGVDQVLLFCFRYDPETGKYTMAVMNLVRAAACSRSSCWRRCCGWHGGGESAQQARGASDGHGEARRWGSGLAGGMLRGLEMFAEILCSPSRPRPRPQRVDMLFFFLCAVTGIMAVLVALLLLYFAVRIAAAPRTTAPRASSAISASNGSGPSRRCSSSSIMFVWGASIYTSVAQPPPDAPEVYVVGKQWMWKFQHPEGQREINELHVPVGRPVKLTADLGGRDPQLLRSGVPHPHGRAARPLHHGLVPGRPRPATYHLFCSQYCGTNHASMIGTVVVMEPARLRRHGCTASAEGSLALQGRKTVSQVSLRQLPQRRRATPAPRCWKTCTASTVHLRDGRTVMADEDYLRESILYPEAKIVAGLGEHHADLQGAGRRGGDHPADRLHQVARAGARRRSASRSSRRPARARRPIEARKRKARSDEHSVMSTARPASPRRRRRRAAENYLNVAYGVTSWLLTNDHKRIAILYLVSVTVMFFLGGRGHRRSSGST